MKEKLKKQIAMIKYLPPVGFDGKCEGCKKTPDNRGRCKCK